jgi:hypothetical protein
VVASLLLLATAAGVGGCSNSSDVRIDSGTPKSASASPPAGEIAVLDSEGYYLTTSGDQIALAHVSPAGDLKRVADLPVESSPHIRPFDSNLLVTGIREGRRVSCSGADCESREFVALVVSTQGRVLRSAVLYEEPGQIQDADSIAVVGVTSSQLWFDVAGTSITTGRDLEVQDKRPSVEGVGCVIDDQFALASGRSVVGGDGSLKVTYETSAWPSGELLSASGTFSPDAASSLQCHDSQFLVVTPTGVPVVAYSAAGGWSAPTAPELEVTAVAPTWSGGPLLALTSSGSLVRWDGDGFASTPLAFDDTQDTPIPTSVYAGGADKAIVACVSVTTELKGSDSPEDPAASQSHGECKTAG